MDMMTNVMLVGMEWTVFVVIICVIHSATFVVYRSVPLRNRKIITCAFQRALLRLAFSAFLLEPKKSS